MSLDVLCISNAQMHARLSCKVTIPKSADRHTRKEGKKPLALVSLGAASFIVCVTAIKAYLENAIQLHLSILIKLSMASENVPIFTFYGLTSSFMKITCSYFISWWAEQVDTSEMLYVLDSLFSS